MPFGGMPFGMLAAGFGFGLVLAIVITPSQALLKKNARGFTQPLDQRAVTP